MAPTISSTNLPEAPSDALPGDARPAVMRVVANFVRPLKGAAMPNPVGFALAIDARLRIKKSFKVRIDRVPEGTVAYAEEIEEFGQGANSSEALHDLGRTIAELYFSLESQADRLGPDMVALRAKLAEHIQRITPAR